MLQALLRHKWRFVVIESEQVNAFVADLLPGFVFVNRGLVSIPMTVFGCCPGLSRSHHEQQLFRLFV